MRTANISAWLTVVLLSLMPKSEACSRPADWDSKERVARAFEGAKAVVIARLVTSSQVSMAGNPRDSGIVEDAWFVVVETLKGPHVVGETIHTRSEFTPGPCGTN